MQRAIEEAKKMYADAFALHMENTSDHANESRWEVLGELIESLEKLPQEPTLEELLEETHATLYQMRDGSGDWKAHVQDGPDYDDYGEAYGKTPREALLSLIEKQPERTGGNYLG